MIIGHRKILFFTFAVVCGIIFTINKGDIPANFLELLKWVGGFFLLGNGFEHYCDSTTPLNTPPPSAPQPDPCIDELSNKLNEIQKVSATTQEGMVAILKIAQGVK